MSRLASRLVAIGVLIIVLGAIAEFAVTPIISSYREIGRSNAQSVALIERYGVLEAARVPLAARLDRLKKRRNRTSGFLRESRESLAAAELQDRVSKIIRVNGGTMRSAQILPSREDSGFRRISIRVRLTADIATLQKILHRLESARTLMFLTSLDINSRVRVRQPKSTRSTNGRLQVRFDLYGYTKRSQS